MIARCIRALATTATALLLASAFAQTGKNGWDQPVRKDFREPPWLDEGIAFVGNWGPLNYRLRKGGGESVLTIDVEELYRREHLPALRSTPSGAVSAPIWLWLTYSGFRYATASHRG
jgi:hypothetical protein